MVEEVWGFVLGFLGIGAFYILVMPETIVLHSAGSCASLVLWQLTTFEHNHSGALQCKRVGINFRK